MVGRPALRETIQERRRFDRASPENSGRRGIPGRSFRSRVSLR
jgi:hypothetical protein